MNKQTISNDRHKGGLRVHAAFGLIAAVLVYGCERGNSGAAQAAPAEGIGPTLASSGAQPGGQQLPPEVGQWVQERRRGCVEEGGRWEGIADFILAGDFNGDGRTDYILQWGGMRCPDNSGSISDPWGRAGPPNDFLISQPGGGYANSGGFSSYLTRDNVVRRGDRVVVVVEGASFREGGEIHKVVWGWDGTEITVLERHDAEGRLVDEDGYPIAAAASGSSASGALPFREGNYHPIPMDPEYTGSLSITASTIHAGGTAVDEKCWVLSTQIDGPSVRMTLACGECVRGDCNHLIPYDEDQTLTIHAESPTVIRITGMLLGHGDGRYRYRGAER